MRQFVDERGRTWTVWEVIPALVERRHKNNGPPEGTSERRRHPYARLPISTGLAEGWLAFEALDGERRRLSPIPWGQRWSDASEQQLRAWCVAAVEAGQARRLVE
ncbi:MAG TPA: hypothetical protein VJN70_04060 [Gemmatimonadaceae bacterium]|nr:hypothetical protein [Gemmatimonadaceae bacterium]